MRNLNIMGQETDDERKPLVHRGQTRLESGDTESPRTYTDPLYGHGLSRPKRRAACTAIVTTKMFERMAFYGFTANTVLFLNGEPFNWLSYQAANSLLVLFGISYMCSVLGGWIADTMLGRFKTILISFVIYICGATLLVVVGYAGEYNEDSIPPRSDKFLVGLCGERTISWTPVNGSGITVPPEIHTDHYCGRVIYPALFLIAIGTGTIRSNLSPFGADQVKYEGPEVMRMFFNWFYWAINVGSFISIGAAAYIQQNINFFAGLLMPGVALVVAMFVFIIGRAFYLSKRPMGSVLTNTRRIIGEACRRRKERTYARQDNSQVFQSNPNPSFLDMAKTRFGGSFHESMVEDVKALGKVILVFIALIPYWAVYFQMQTTFLIQGLHMKFDFSDELNENNTIEDCVNKSNIHSPPIVGPHPFQVPVAWLTLFDIIVVLIFVPIMDRIIYPRLDKSGWNFSHLRRMAIGMVFSSIAMVAAGVLETFRLKTIKDDGYCLVILTGNSYYYAANLWIFYQIPQYTLIGISEVFTSVAGLEFAYSQAPRSMQGLIMGLFFLCTGLGSFLSSGVLALLSIPGISGFTPADSGNINLAHLDYVFFVFAGIQVVALVIFGGATYHYEKSDKTSSSDGLGSFSQTRHSQHVQRHSIPRGSSVES